jgi:hypothetical protein
VKSLTICTVLHKTNRVIKTLSSFLFPTSQYQIRINLQENKKRALFHIEICTALAICCSYMQTIKETSGNVKSKDIALSKQLCHKFINWWTKASESGCEMENWDRR